MNLQTIRATSVAVNFTNKTIFQQKSKKMSPKLSKDARHDHFWIADEMLFESYMTIRGLRYRFRMDVKGMPDAECVTEEMLIFIEKEYLS